MAKAPETVLIGDVTFPVALLGVRHVVPQQSGHRWRLTTRRGVVLAEFDSPEAMKSWWELFLQYPRPATKGGKTRNKQRNKRPYGSQAPIKDDPLMPWNAQYDMPEFDAS